MLLRGAWSARVVTRNPRLSPRDSFGRGREGLKVQMVQEVDFRYEPEPGPPSVTPVHKRWDVHETRARDRDDRDIPLGNGGDPPARLPVSVSPLKDQAGLGVVTGRRSWIAGGSWLLSAAGSSSDGL